MEISDRRVPLFFLIAMTSLGVLFLLFSVFEKEDFSEPEKQTKTYRSEALAFSIDYPEEYSIDERYQYEAFGPEKIPGVAFLPLASFWSGTNLSSDTRLSVEVLPGADECTADLFLPGESSPRLERIGNREYSVVQSVGAAAGNRYEEQVYALEASDPCLAVRYFIHSANIENYESGEVRAFDREKLIADFDAMRDSLRIQAGR